MLTNGRQRVRDYALNRILKSRNERKTKSKVQEYRIPRLNYSVSDYTYINNWYEWEAKAPLVLAEYTNECLSTFIHNEVSTEMFPQFPCHIQPVE